MSQGAVQSQKCRDELSGSAWCAEMHFAIEAILKEVIILKNNVYKPSFCYRERKEYRRLFALNQL